MYINSAYLRNSRIDFKDYTRPLIVGSCGTYRLEHHPTLPTHRPKGRQDYQLLYIATGQTHFFFQQNQETIVPAGSFVLYAPGEEQKYVYYAKDHPEVFWVHFTGYDATNILRFYKLNPGEHVYDTGTLPEFRWIYRRMILELQLCMPLYEEMLASLLNDLFLLICRRLSDPADAPQTEIQEAVAYFSEHYNENISIDRYAREHHISPNQFIRNFAQMVNLTPKQYVVSIRIANAQMLLETSNYTIKEIAGFVGYNDPQYFCRHFRQEVGMPPSRYREQYGRQNELRREFQA